MESVIFTIGHSTRTITEFIELLKEYCIEQVIDVRTIPRSEHNPQFNSDKLAEELGALKISYVHLEKLGGLRHTKKDSVNIGWKNSSFRGFADYMQTKEFEEGLNKLVSLSKKKVSAIICAEAVPWRCHRSLIADALAVRKIQVVHIISRTNSFNHKITSFAKIKNTKIIYPRNAPAGI